MSCRRLILSLVMTCLAVAPVLADAAVRDASPSPRSLGVVGQTLHGGQPDLTRAARDTMYLLGGPDRTDGTFETGWNGWTSIDFTEPVVPDGGYWQVSDFNAANLGGHGAGNHAMWCGTTFDGDPGYGNNWDAVLQWEGPALDAGVTATIRVTARLNHDTEPEYDSLSLQILREGVWETIASYDGMGSDIAVDVSTQLISESPATPLRLRWWFLSDSWASQEDGNWPNDGACQIDDLAVFRDGEQLAFEDFESGQPLHWFEEAPVGVGDYAAIYQNLQDLDECISNHTRQVAFVDDGVVVPGTGGTNCITWCYGPGGYLVNNTGGLLGPDEHILNGIVTPPIAVPAGLDGLDVAFDVYDASHDYTSNDAGIFHNWKVRSTASADPGELWLAGWRDRGLYYQGDDRYERGGGFVSDLIVSGARWMQLCLEVGEWGYIWDLDGADGHPTPYFDNVAITAYEFSGPFLTTRDIDLAQDAFPQTGDLDFADLAANSCRFDMARNISRVSELRNDPGDSLVVTVQPRDGGTLIGEPRLIVSMHPNPLFDAVRVLPPGFTVTPDQKIKGTVAGWLVDANNDRYAFDLPDTGFFFPGDEIHYFFEAVDVRDGQQGLTRLPADTTGFDRFTGNQPIHTVFPPEFIVRALPTLFSDTPGDQPRILFWDDSGDRDEDVRWRWALADMGYNEGQQYDVYRTQAPLSGVGNGLGGRATSAQLDGYRTLLYTCADNAVFTLSRGDFDGDPSIDLQVLNGWFDRGDKSAIMVGDHLLSSVLDQGSTGSAFVTNYLGLELVDPPLRQLIGGQTSPLVVILPGNGVLVTVDEWVDYGGCPDIADFDAVVTAPGADRLAEFTDPAGNDTVYPYAAAVLFENPGPESRVVTMPHGFAAIQNAPDWVPPNWAPARARSLMLRDILNLFGLTSQAPIAAPDLVGALAVSAHPNPFNPRCTIALSLARAADASVKIYDLRGALVRTLQDGPLVAGRHDLTWAGEDDRGAQSASGIYFYEVRAAGERRLGKLTMVK